MKPQQTAQERAEKFVFDNAASLNGTTQDFITTYKLAEASGERIALERLAVKESEGFEEWFENLVEPAMVKKGYSLAARIKGRAELEVSWVARGTPLLARIELLEMRNKELDGAMAGLIEASECRGDEDCDHCEAARVLGSESKALKQERA